MSSSRLSPTARSKVLASSAPPTAYFRWTPRSPTPAPRLARCAMGARRKKIDARKYAGDRARMAKTQLQGPRLDRPACRRDAQGHRRRGARILPLDRARQALHRARHGAGPGQDLARQRRRRARGGERTQDRRGRRLDFSSAIHARADDRARGLTLRRAHEPAAPPAARGAPPRARRRLRRLRRLAAPRLLRRNPRQGRRHRTGSQRCA